MNFQCETSAKQSENKKNGENKKELGSLPGTNEQISGRKETNLTDVSRDLNVMYILQISMEVGFSSFSCGSSSVTLKNHSASESSLAECVQAVKFIIYLSKIGPIGIRSHLGSIHMVVFYMLHK